MTGLSSTGDKRFNKRLSNLKTRWSRSAFYQLMHCGAIVFFLFVLAMFTEKRKLKYAFLVGAIFSLMLSWGKNFPILTDFFIDYFPLYNKFRAVSSIQVILELCIPVLAVLGLYSFFKLEKGEQWKALWKSSAIAVGVLVLLFVCKGMFSFSAESDSYFRQAYGEIGQPFVDALKEDRRAMYTSDLLRSMGLIAAAFALFWLFIKEKVSQTISVILIGSLMVLDLYVIDKNYVNADDFVNARQVNQPFQPTEADLKILEDKDPNFRVFEPSQGMAGGRTSYFHKAIGGYSAVKPQRIQQLYDYQIANNNIQVLNMLNVKYVIQTTEEGQPIPLQNPNANGNAWFVSNIKTVKNADEEIRALDSLDTKNEAVVDKEFMKSVSSKSFVKDSLATITLEEYKPNYLKYTSQNTNKGLAIFSEIYYPKGWKITIDGKEAEQIRANYVLRALEIPAVKHTIEFKFEP
ncbi:MAG: YfhO family protein, partial [Bdellovibrionales bacterium]|nr:YfhO family protein [Bdellovibrionales bacterium]